MVAADYWEVDDRGYPSFEEREGRSAVLVRTSAGADAYGRAVAAQALGDEALDIGELKRVQPYQVERRKLAAARAVGFRLAGAAIPSWAGFSRARWILAQPRVAVRQAVGSFKRGIRKPTGPGLPR
jgi:coenzyme F420 hydrogenase subunit beta